MPTLGVIFDLGIASTSKGLSCSIFCLFRAFFWSKVRPISLSSLDMVGWPRLETCYWWWCNEIWAVAVEISFFTEWSYRWVYTRDLWLVGSVEETLNAWMTLPFIIDFWTTCWKPWIAGTGSPLEFLLGLRVSMDWGALLFKNYCILASLSTQCWVIGSSEKTKSASEYKETWSETASYKNSSVLDCVNP